STRSISSPGMPWLQMTAKPYSENELPSSSASSSSGRCRSTVAILSMGATLACEEEPGEGGAHQVGERARGKRAQAEPGDHRALVGREAARHRHLDGDRGEVGEAAQREGDDRPAALAQRGGIERAEIDEGDEFVEHDLGAEQPAGDLR